MRRLLALSLVSFSLALSGAAGLAAPAAFAAAASTTPQPTLNLSNAEQNAAAAENTVTSTPAVSTSTSTGLSSTDGLLIALIAVLVLGGISFYIWRESRSAASALGHHASDDAMYARAHAGSKTPHKPRKLKPAERKRRKRGRAR